jgi:hypothetical protein
MHVTPTHLRNHLRPVFASLEARLGTLNELTQTTPIAILAETLGYKPPDVGSPRSSLGVDLRAVYRHPFGRHQVTEPTAKEQLSRLESSMPGCNECRSMTLRADPRHAVFHS